MKWIIDHDLQPTLYSKITIRLENPVQWLIFNHTGCVSSIDTPHLKNFHPQKWLIKIEGEKFLSEGCQYPLLLLLTHPVSLIFANVYVFIDFFSLIFRSQEDNKSRFSKTKSLRDKFRDSKTWSLRRSVEKESSPVTPNHHCDKNGNSDNNRYGFT